MVIGPYFPAGGRAQRGDRDRPGVVRVVLVRIARGQQPHPRSQLGLDVQDPFPGGGQLLGQHMAQAAGAFDRPGPLRPRRRPLHQLLRLRRTSPDPQLAQRLLACPDRHRSMRTLVRINPYHHCCHETALPVLHPDRTVAGMPNYGPLGRSRLFRATPRQGLTGRHLVIKPGRTSSRQADREPGPSEPLNLREPPSLGQQGLRLQSDHAAWTSCRTVSLALNPVRGRSKRGLRIVTMHSYAGQSALC